MLGFATACDSNHVDSEHGVVNLVVSHFKGTMTDKEIIYLL